MTIASLNYKENKTILICFVSLKYLDKISYLKIFKYLNKNFKFNPTILHSDFENALS